MDNHGKTETLAEVLSEMRKVNGFSVPYAPSDYRGVWTEDLVKYADRIEAAWKCERDEMLDVIVRIGNWCAQDLAENAYTSDSSGNYLKTLNGLCDICRPFMQEAARLKRYGGVE